MKQKYVIIGAGLFGCTFAFLARSRGCEVFLFDKRNHLGGNLYCRDYDGVIVHEYGPHIFHTSNKEVYDFVTSLVPCHSFINSPIAMLEGRAYNLPFNMNTFSQLFGCSTPEQAYKIISRERSEIANPSNLEEQAISLVGRTLYEKFIKNYTEKQWSRKCSELPAEIIKRIPVRFTYDNNYFDDRYQFIPDNGYNGLIERLVSGCLAVSFNEVSYSQIQSFIQRGESVRFLYTGSLDELYGYRYGRLQYRSLEFRHKSVNTRNFQGNAVVNYTGNDFKYTRSVEHRFFEPECKARHSIVTYETPVEYNGNNEPFYPVNDSLNNRLYQKYRKLADSEKDIIFGGRLADYRYYDMDEIIEKAFELWKKEELRLHA